MSAFISALSLRNSSTTTQTCTTLKNVRMALPPQVSTSVLPSRRDVILNQSNISSQNLLPAASGKGLRVGILCAKWNREIIDRLVEGCLKTLTDAGVRREDIVLMDVPGSYELPFAAKCLTDRSDIDAVIGIGVLIKGETMHFEYISDHCTSGLMRVGLDSGKPVIFGVLTCLTHDQAVARSTGESNHGLAWGRAVVDMCALKNQCKQ
eukprot:TRINITY_DN11309_c0_g1::TRINITY_DN11309_c0_g1_i1::g.622::m.622 TRINITY_DN11309_c0_g1::TRINITY_DN11309_c0_g1_i1::g.622  ORF type:complete len:208 (-),score=22.83,sp/P50861/RIB4_YEAST/48.98/1e-39,DMRL_synthase/PF00885.14/7.8e-48 TRINITY_DN11309_c0_g1_i1:393-1016(-)